MPEKELPIDTIADAHGDIQFARNVEIPLSVTIKLIKLRTTSNCRERIHKTTARVNGETIINNEQIKDCSEFVFSNEIHVQPGQLDVELLSQGFDSAEHVQGTVHVKFTIFGLEDDAFDQASLALFDAVWARPVMRP